MVGFVTLKRVHEGESAPPSPDRLGSISRVAALMSKVCSSLLMRQAPTQGVAVQRTNLPVVGTTVHVGLREGNAL